MHIYAGRCTYRPDNNQKIVGHSGAMTLTEKVYTHMDIGELVKAINQI